MSTLAVSHSLRPDPRNRFRQGSPIVPFSVSSPKARRGSPSGQSFCGSLPAPKIILALVTGFCGVTLVIAGVQSELDAATTDHRQGWLMLLGGGLLVGASLSSLLVCKPAHETSFVARFLCGLLSASAALVPMFIAALTLRQTIALVGLLPIFQLKLLLREARQPTTYLTVGYLFSQCALLAGITFREIRDAQLLQDDLRDMKTLEVVCDLIPFATICAAMFLTEDRYVTESVARDTGAAVPTTPRSLQHQLQTSKKATETPLSIQSSRQSSIRHSAVSEATQNGGNTVRMIFSPESSPNTATSSLLELPALSVSNVNHPFANGAQNTAWVSASSMPDDDTVIASHMATPVQCIEDPEDLIFEDHPSPQSATLRPPTLRRSQASFSKDGSARSTPRILGDPIYCVVVCVSLADQGGVAAASSPISPSTNDLSSIGSQFTPSAYEALLRVCMTSARKHRGSVLSDQADDVYLAWGFGDNSSSTPVSSVYAMRAVIEIVTVIRHDAIFEKVRSSLSVGVVSSQEIPAVSVAGKFVAMADRELPNAAYAVMQLARRHSFCTIACDAGIAAADLVVSLPIDLVVIGRTGSPKVIYDFRQLLTSSSRLASGGDWLSQFQARRDNAIGTAGKKYEEAFGLFLRGQLFEAKAALEDLLREQPEYSIALALHRRLAAHTGPARFLHSAPSDGRGQIARTFVQRWS